MRNLIGLVVSLLVLVGVGAGQVLTVKQQEIFTQKAEWVKVVEDDGEPLYVDVRSITRVRVGVLFRIKVTMALAGNGYATIAGGCLKGEYGFTNMFLEMPDGSLIKQDGVSDMFVAEKGNPMYEALVFACNNKHAQVIREYDNLLDK